jgi:hypothetical protein
MKSFMVKGSEIGILAIQYKATKFAHTCIHLKNYPNFFSNTFW